MILLATVYINYSYQNYVHIISRSIYNNCILKVQLKGYGEWENIVAVIYGAITYIL